MRDNPHHSFAASQITRILILSYFVALALGLIRGAELQRLTSPFLSAPWATYAISGIVLTLTALVLVGILRRPAALILALTLFWASYMTMYATGDIAGFWRDLALIGGLLISAGVGQGWSVRDRATSAPEPDYELNIASERGPEPGPDTVQVPLRRVTITRLREDLDMAREG
ncbi:MAG: hypothetical protein HKN18_04375 [Silicimonas sp.]|nr:hypothetical protein [Silicimonas sp.]